MVSTTKLGSLVKPSEADAYVYEGTVQHLTWDIIAWIGAVQPAWKIVRLRYEWEKLIDKSRGKSLFLEVTYRGRGEFPCASYYFYPLINWKVYFVDFVELSSCTKVVIRLVHKEDL